MLPSIAGLTLAWGGVLLATRIATIGRGQLALWSIFAAVLAIVLLWERQPLSSLWLQPFAWSSIAWGIGYAVAGVLLIGPAREVIRRALRLPGFAAGMTPIVELPLWVRAALAISAGIIEETLFTGFTITRLATLTGRLWLAAVLAVVAFAAIHIPNWGVGPAASFLVGGIPWVAFFLWRRDLLAMIVAHAAIDLWGFAISPLFSKWWLEPPYA
jgi:membrane protease YdiL (CAAX protease family)